MVANSLGHEGNEEPLLVLFWVVFMYFYITQNQLR